jgi:putative acetyltransferase
MLIRHEESGDIAAIRAVNRSAFPSDEEGLLVDSLRAANSLSISLVAEEGDQVVGHIAFSPVSVAGAPGGLGLAPMAVSPAFQRQGIGSRLVREGISAAARSGAGFVVVLGHPEYYPRFGFERASLVGLSNEYGADEAFMVLEIRPGAIPGGGGLVKYCPEFGAWS